MNFGTQNDVGFVCTVDGKLDNSPIHTTQEAAWIEARGMMRCGPTKVCIIKVSLKGYITE